MRSFQINEGSLKALVLLPLLKVEMSRLVVASVRNRLLVVRHKIRMSNLQKHSPRKNTSRRFHLIAKVCRFFLWLSHRFLPLFILYLFLLHLLSNPYTVIKTVLMQDMTYLRLLRNTAISS